MAGRLEQIRLFTIGHSNQSFEEFRLLLEGFQIRVIADVRRFPSSRKFPHFNRETLHDLLDAEGIQYVWFEALGGLRQKGTGHHSIGQEYMVQCTRFLVEGEALQR